MERITVMKKRIISLILAVVMLAGMIPVIASAAETPEIAKASITLDGILNLNFKVKSNGVEDMSGYSVQVTIGDETAYQEITTPTRDGDLYVYTAKLPVHKLDQKIAIRLMYGDNVVQEKTDWTVASYLAAVTKQDSAYTALADAMLNYGAYAKYYYTEKYTDEQGTPPNVDAVEQVAKEALSIYRHTVAHNTNPNLHASAWLYIDDAVDLRFRFNADAWGTNYSLLVNNKAVTASRDGEHITYSIPELRPEYWTKAYNVKVMNGDTPVFEVNYSVMSYAYAQLKKDSTAAKPALVGLMKAMYLYCTEVSEVSSLPEKQFEMLGNITVPCPYILNDGDKYYLYEIAYYGAYRVWSSTDLEKWYNEGLCYEVAPGHKYYEARTDEDYEGGFWAPEVFKYTYNGETAYYMFSTFTQYGTNDQQGTTVLRSESPLGPFEQWSTKDYLTPEGHSCLDGTLYFENGVPYMIYAHEWQCNHKDCDDANMGSMAYIQLSADLKSTVGEPVELFEADDAGYAWGGVEIFGTVIGGDKAFVTDGPWVYSRDGQNYLLWSTRVEDNNYILACTPFESLKKGITAKNNTYTVYDKDGGHPMTFTDMNGKDWLIMHTNDNGGLGPVKETLFDVTVTNGKLSLTAVSIWDGFEMKRAGNYSEDYITDQATVFIGDSFFDLSFWNNFAYDLEGKEAYNFGISGSTAEDWYNYASRGILLDGTGTAPRNIVVNLGSNDYYNDYSNVKNSQNDVMARFEKLYNKLHENYPSAHIYAFSTISRNGNFANTNCAESLKAGNTLMSQWCADKDWITFIDITGLITDLDDGIHPNDKYYTSVYLSKLDDAGIEYGTTKVDYKLPNTAAEGCDPDKEAAAHYQWTEVSGNAFTVEATFVPDTPTISGRSELNGSALGFAIKQGNNTLLITETTAGELFTVSVGGGSARWVGTNGTNKPLFKTGGNPVKLTMTYYNGVISIYDASGNCLYANVDLSTDKWTTFDWSKPVTVGFGTYHGSIFGVRRNGGGIISDVTATTGYGIKYEGLEGATHTNPTAYTTANAASTVLSAPSGRKYYSFAGWYVGDTQITTLAGQTGGITVTAKWIREYVYPTYELPTVGVDNHPEKDGLHALWTDYSGTHFTVTARFDPDTGLISGLNGSALGFAIKQGDTEIVITESNLGTMFTVAKKGTSSGGGNKRWANGTGSTQIFSKAGEVVELTMTYEKGMVKIYDAEGNCLYDNIDLTEETWNSISKPGIDWSQPVKVGFGLWHGSIDKVVRTGGGTVDNVQFKELYTVTYVDLNGGEHDNPEVYSPGDTTVLSDPTEPEGYTFVGWFLPNGQQITSLAGLSGDLTIAAHWTRKVIEPVYTLPNSSACGSTEPKLHTVWTNYSGTYFEAEATFTPDTGLLSGLNGSAMGFAIKQGTTEIVITENNLGSLFTVGTDATNGTGGGKASARWKSSNTGLQIFSEDDTFVVLKMTYQNGIVNLYDGNGHCLYANVDLSYDKWVGIDWNQPVTLGFGLWHGTIDDINRTGGGTVDTVKFTATDDKAYSLPNQNLNTSCNMQSHYAWTGVSGTSFTVQATFTPDTTGHGDGKNESALGFAFRQDDKTFMVTQEHNSNMMAVNGVGTAHNAGGTKWNQLVNKTMFPTYGEGATFKLIYDKGIAYIYDAEGTCLYAAIDLRKNTNYGFDFTQPVEVGFGVYHGSIAQEVRSGGGMIDDVTVEVGGVYSLLSFANNGCTTNDTQGNERRTHYNWSNYSGTSFTVQATFAADTKATINTDTRRNGSALGFAFKQGDITVLLTEDECTSMMALTANGTNTVYTSLSNVKFTRNFTTAMFEKAGQGYTYTLTLNNGVVMIYNEGGDLLYTCDMTKLTTLKIDWTKDVTVGFGVYHGGLSGQTRNGGGIITNVSFTEN